MQLQVGVKVIIRNSTGLYLFLERRDILPGHDKTSWDIPGGRIEPNEALDDALRREVREELGVELVGKPQLMNAQDIFVPTKNFHVVRLTYIVDIESIDVTLSDEHIDYKWLTIEEVLQLHVEPFLKETILLLEMTSA